MAFSKKTDTEITIEPLALGIARFRIIGTRPLFQNAMSAKAKQQLLLGGGAKKGAAARATLKHHPLEEYREAMERPDEADCPTAIVLNSVALKAAMCDAAIESTGTSKASAQRLLFIPTDYTPLYGIPKLRMDIVRSAGMNKTPDVRTRPFFERWGAEIEVHFVHPQLSAHAVFTLAANAGQVIGIGDYRQQKGKGSYGLFRVVAEGQEDAEWDWLVANAGRAPQQAAIDDPDFAGRSTEWLMRAFSQERIRRAA